MKPKLKKIMKISITIVIGLMLCIIGGITYLFQGLQKGRDVQLSGTNQLALQDGIYLGEYRAGRWTNQLEVRVKDQKIIEIVMLKDVIFAMPEARNELFIKVIELQTTLVDVVSQATVTSKAYLKAIEEALKNEQRERK